MIYTLTLNPAIDKIIELDNFQLEKTNKADNEQEIIGGKGINVAVMLNNLGYETCAIAFMGSENQNLFIDYLNSKNIKHIFHLINGKTRTNLKIKSLSTMQETELNGIAFSVNNEDIEQIINQIKTKLTQNDWLIMSGSLPQNCNENIYQQLALYCSTNKINFIVDTTKQTLIDTLKYHPFLIKPNIDELNEIFNTNYNFIEHQSEIIDLGKKLIELGVQNVIISSSDKGSMLISNDKVYLANTAKGKLVNSSGSGDSMIAGFIGTYDQTKDYYQSFLMAVCAGSATAFTQQLAIKQQVLQLIDQIKIKEIIS